MENFSEVLSGGLAESDVHLRKLSDVDQTPPVCLTLYEGFEAHHETGSFTSRLCR